MKINYSLSLKLTLIVVSVSAIIILSLTYVNIREETKFFEDAYFDKATAIGKVLDASIISHNLLEDKQKLQSYIINVSNSNPDVIKISVNLPDENVLKVAVSSDEDYIGSYPNVYNNLSYEEGAVVFIPEHSGNSHNLTLLMPLNISGLTVGTYEIVLSMSNAYAALDLQLRNLVLISFVSILILILSFLFLLRRAIVKPVIAFRDAANVIGGGNLDEKVEIKSRDELGELASAFNQMTTDLKKSRNKIEKYSKVLENLLKQKDEFIHQLGHDLKNPLTPLVGLLPMIMEQEKDTKLKEHLRVIVFNVEYMRELIFKTLELARLRSSKIKFDLENINLTQEIKNALENQQLLLKEHNINVENNVNDKIFVKADKLRLVELFNNLISNAVKYTPEDGGKITIDAKEDKDVVIVSVRDDGIGMTMEQQEHVFDEFYMADKSRKGLDSTGLGLSICKRIVEKHGGKIWAESPGKGKGSAFYFTLKASDEKNIKDM